MTMATVRPAAWPPSRSASIGMLSTYPPTECGLATFTAALLTQLSLPSGRTEVIRVVDEVSTHPGAEVVGHLVNGSPASARAAVELLNSYDVVLLQHEYGIYGGPDGSDVLELVDGLTVPLVVVLHTVLEAPTTRQRLVLERLLAAADVIVTMTETANLRLVRHYAADPSHLVVIPHGAVDHGRWVKVPPRNDRPTILTWGLLGPGKGIEWAVEAMPGLRDLNPRYLVLGKTHPKVLERDGEAYRDALDAQVERLGVRDLVELDPSYLDVPALARIVAGADVVLLPYDSREQVTSGVLIEAVAAGRPVVSTAFPHALELLLDGPGLVVPQRDAGALEHALRRVLSEPGLAGEMAAQAAAKAPGLLWPAVGARYRQLVEGLVSAALTEAS
jgi:glycosyltransferase involved in cell wall biosynthesis